MSQARFDDALKWLADHLTANKVGIGVDLATTEKGVSNPTSVSIAEREGDGFIVRAVFVWKTADPDVATGRFIRVVETINARKEGGRARRMLVDATNERYYAKLLKKEMRGLVPVELVIASETIEMPGGESITRKQFLGAQYVAELEDNHLTLPPERYLKEDHRLVKREKGSFVCEADNQGRHGDTFDSNKLAVQALVVRGGGGRAIAAALGEWKGGMQ